MADYRKYLAQQILTEDKPVTYRLLSRALKVHVNSAKEMLFEFHKWQNDKSPGKIHATYLVYGTKRKVELSDGDVEMADSGSEDMAFSEDVPTQTLSLVKEEQLNNVLSQYEEVTSIHIYSLAPHPLKDLQVLAETGRQVMESSVTDESFNASKVYGGISNLNMRRRERRGAGAKVAALAAPRPSVVKQEPKVAAKSSASVAVKEEPKPTSTAASKDTPTSSATSKKPTAAPSLKRQASSGIGQMFAKAAAKPKKQATAPKPSTKDDSTMALSDDGEDDEPMTDVKQETEEAIGSRKLRKDREAELRRMMEEDDDDDDDDDEPEEKADSPDEEPMEDEPSAPELEPVKEEPTEVVSSTDDGRRRGRRRVTRKKQVMDDQGYLVTIQEQGWESFSEDEAPAPKAKSQQPSSAPPAAKPKKAPAKGAQGNIMSFFSKK